MMPKSLNLYAELLPGSHTEIFSPIGVNVAYGLAICCKSSSLCNLPNTSSFDAGKIEVLIIIIAHSLFGMKRPFGMLRLPLLFDFGARSGVKIIADGVAGG